MLHIIPTVDYEIFGNGRGDVKRHMIKPLNRILDLCDRHGGKLTVMVDQIELNKFQKNDYELNNRLGYSPADCILKQLKQVVERGHDVQLHIHPQWVDAKYENGKWIIEEPHRSIDSFSIKKIERLLKRGKSFLESELREVDPDYRCIALRLTNQGWTEASDKVIRAMSRVGLTIHSLSVTDIEKSYPKGYWSLDDSVFEIPIFSRRVPNRSKYTFWRLVTAFYRVFFTGFSNGETVSNDNQGYHEKLDFCKMSVRAMNKAVESARRNYKHREYEVPVVMIGHTKDFFNYFNFGSFINNRETNEFDTLRGFWKTII